MRHDAGEIRGLVYRMEAAQTNNSKGPWHTHTHIYINTDAHRHPRLYPPEWRETHSPRFEVPSGVASRIKRVKRDAG